MSSLMDVDPDDIYYVLNYKAGYPPPPQVGPLRFSEKEKQCLVRKHDSKNMCRSPTSILIYGTPMCYMHALYELNNHIVNLRKDEPTGICPTCRESKLEVIAYAEISCGLCGYVKVI